MPNRFAIHELETLAPDTRVEAGWTDDPACPRCGGREYSEIRARRPYQGKACRSQASVAAGTVFHKTQQKACRTKGEPAPSFPRGGGVASSGHETGSRLVALIVGVVTVRAELWLKTFTSLFARCPGDNYSGGAYR